MLSRSKLFLRVLLAAFIVSAVLPVAALAGTGEALTIPTLKIWTIVAATLVTAVTYVINKWAPWVGQGTKATVLMITAAISAGLVQAIDGGTVGFNNSTANLVILAVVTAFGSHLLIWKPSGIQAKLAESE